ncbi:MAG: hypothetical protein LBF88_06665 [Planctomycetaceae bacterium]|jgi:hypothetical protein|nr:hypothetical protein [Planctomycetaceae bacterium]
MTQLQSFSDTTFGNVHVSSEVPCPAPDWESGVLRAYSPEERRAIHSWYAQCGLVEPLEEILRDAKPITEQDLEEMKKVSQELFPPDKEFNDFWDEIELNLPRFKTTR